MTVIIFSRWITTYQAVNNKCRAKSFQIYASRLNIFFCWHIVDQKFQCKQGFVSKSDSSKDYVEIPAYTIFKNALRGVPLFLTLDKTKFNDFPGCGEFCFFFFVPFLFLFNFLQKGLKTIKTTNEVFVWSSFDMLFFSHLEFLQKYIFDFFFIFLFFVVLPDLLNTHIKTLSACTWVTGTWVTGTWVTSTWAFISTTVTCFQWNTILR